MSFLLCLEASLLSNEELKGITGINDHQLQEEIKERDVHMLGRFFDTSSLSGLLGRLDLTRAEHSDVKTTMDREGIQAGVAHALRVWRGANPSRATFRSLLDILLNLRQGAASIQVCEYIVEIHQ